MAVGATCVGLDCVRGGVRVASQRRGPLVAPAVVAPSFPSDGEDGGRARLPCRPSPPEDWCMHTVAGPERAVDAEEHNPTTTHDQPSEKIEPRDRRPRPLRKLPGGLGRARDRTEAGSRPTRTGGHLVAHAIRTTIGCRACNNPGAAGAARRGFAARGSRRRRDNGVQHDRGPGTSEPRPPWQPKPAVDASWV